MSRNILAVARHEYVTNVRRKEFILVTLGFPVLMLLLMGISFIGAAGAVGAFSAAKQQRVAYVDSGNHLNWAAIEGDKLNLSMTEFATEADASARVKSREYDVAVVLDKDYLKSGGVSVYRHRSSLLDKTERIPVGSMLTHALLGTADLNADVLQRAMNPVANGVISYTLNKQGEFSKKGIIDEVSKMAVPYVFTLLLTTSIFISASYLLRGIAEEKENRVIEVILSSIPAGDLLRGKLLGLGGVAMTQVGIWMLFSAVPAMLIYSKFVQIGFGTLALVALLFVIGFEMYGAMMAGLGALGTSFRETQQIAGSVSMVAIIPLIVIVPMLDNPNGIMARVMSFIPPTAPITMVVRCTAGEVPPWEVALSLLLMIGFIWLVLGISTKLFRYGLLITGKRPGFRETLRWLRAA